MSGLTSEERAERFWSKVDKTETCWLWQGGADQKGYGRFTPAPGKSTAAHRWAYEQSIGPIPEGYTLDHLCRVHGCVNPDHLEPVTRGANVLRGIGLTATQARQKTCRRGHQLDGEGKRRDGRTYRYCRTCKVAKEAERRLRVGYPGLNECTDRCIHPGVLSREPIKCPDCGRFSAHPWVWEGYGPNGYFCDYGGTCPACGEWSS